jgi:AcrR family transcriptional regulator
VPVATRNLAPIALANPGFVGTLNVVHSVKSVRMGTAERRQREAEERRRSILAAGRKVFWARGYDRATVPEIAHEAELAPGTLYLYFPGKAALYVELLLEGYEELRTRLEKAVAGRAGPRRTAERLTDAFFDFAREVPEYFEIVFFILGREGLRDREGVFEDEQRQRLERSQAACLEVVAGVVDRLGTVSRARRDDVVSAVWSMLSGVIYHFRSSPDFDRVRREAVRLVLAALGGDTKA